MDAPRPVTDQVIDQLAPLLGPTTARVAVRTAAIRAAGVAPEALAAAHLPKLLEALRPMLTTMLGERAAAATAAKIRESIR